MHQAYCPDCLMDFGVFVEGGEVKLGCECYLQSPEEFVLDLQGQLDE